MRWTLQARKGILSELEVAMRCSFDSLHFVFLEALRAVDITEQNGGAAVVMCCLGSRGLVLWFFFVSSDSKASSANGHSDEN